MDSRNWRKRNPCSDNEAFPGDLYEGHLERRRSRWRKGGSPIRMSGFKGSVPFSLFLGGPIVVGAPIFLELLAASLCQDSFFVIL